MGKINLQWAGLAFIIMYSDVYAFEKVKSTLFFRNILHFFAEKTYLMTYVFRVFTYVWRERNTSRNVQLSPHSQDEFISSIYLFILCLKSYKFYVRKKIHYVFAQKSSLVSLVVENQNFNSLKLVKIADFLLLVILIMPS